MQSLVSLTRALIVEPDLLIWDAPLSDIDMNWSGQIMTVLKKMKAGGKTLILFTNRKFLIEEMADVHLHLVEGELVNAEATGPGKPDGHGY